MDYLKKYKKYKLKYLNLKNKINQNGGSIGDNFVKKISDYYLTILESQGYHVFIPSYKWWTKSLENWRNENLKFKEEVIYKPNDITNLKLIESLKTSKKIANKKELLEIYELMNSTNDFNKIRKRLDKLFYVNLPSTIENLKKYLNEIKKTENTINVIIIGAGPLGLFSSLYLDYYYNNLMLNLGKKINVLLLDNRIFKEGIKKPYNRCTQFGFDIQNIQVFLKQIFCWNLTNAGITRKFDYIYIFELLLYITAFGKDIPMYFTDKYQDYQDIKELSKKYNFHYIIDCTGGRLNTNLKEVLYFKNIILKENNLEVKLDTDNYYKLFINNKKQEQYMFNLYLFDKNEKQIINGTKNYMTEINNKNDLILLQKFKNKILEIKDYIRLSENLEDRVSRNLLQKILSEEKINNVKYIKLSLFDVSSRHLSFISKKINRNLVYLGLGDTLGHSEYGIWFGMKDSILLSKHIIHLLESNHIIPKNKT